MSLKSRSWLGPRRSFISDGGGSDGDDSYSVPNHIHAPSLVCRNNQNHCHSSDDDVGLAPGRHFPKAKEQIKEQ
jgi:hypothetical protein